MLKRIATLLFILAIVGCTHRENSTNVSNTDHRSSGYTVAGQEYSGINDTIADVHYTKGLTCKQCHPNPIADTMLFRPGHSSEDSDVTESCRSCHEVSAEKNMFHENHWSYSARSGRQIACRVCHAANAPRPDSFPFVRIRHKIHRPQWSTDPPFGHSYCKDCH
jgi:hypothetical protein